MVKLVRQTSDEGEITISCSEITDFQGRPEPEKLRYFGDYEVLNEVGRGGMGVVYKARQLSLQRTVALKLIAGQQVASPKALERFRTEAEAAANLDHPNIVPIYETGTFEGRHYFSMKLVEGQSLALRMEDFQLPITDSGSSSGSRSQPKTIPAARQSQIAKLLTTVAEAVHYAHQRGILHRDLKPGNILIDSSDQPHVTDFGLAKRVEDDSSLTLSGEVLGTPAYMAPEQAAGKANQITTSADVYSLGAILYELLTCRPPFRAQTSVETLHAVVHQEPAAPRVLNRAAARDLETICLKCLEKQPARRYPSAQVLAEDLRRFTNGEPILARAATRTEKVWRWCRRKPALAGTLLLLHIVLALGMAGILWQWRRASQKEFDARENLYAADINAAQQALAADNLRQALDLLRRHIPGPGEPDLRGFEWRYLWRQCQSDELFSLPGHNNSAICVAFSPDGRTLATGSSAQIGQPTAKIWDLANRRLLKTLIGYTNDVCCVSFSPDGQFLAVACQTAVGIWNAKTFEQLHSLPGCALVGKFSPRGDYLLSANTNSLVLWDIHTWTPVVTNAVSKSWTGELSDLSFFNGRVAFSSDGSRIAAPTEEGLKLYSVPDLRERAIFNDRLPRTRFVAFSPDGRIVAGCTAHDRNVKLWNVNNLQEAALLSGHSDTIEDAAFSPDGKWLAACSCDQTLKLWEVASGKLVRSFKGHAEEVYDLAFSPDGKQLASVGKDGSVKIWDAANSPNQASDLGNDFAPLGFDSEGNLVAFTRTNHALAAFDPESLQIARAERFMRRKEKGRYGFLLAFRYLFCDGHTIAFPARTSETNETGWIELWDLNARQFLCSPPQVIGNRVVFASHRRLLATCTSNNTVTLWQVPQGTPKFVLTNATAPAAISPDETMIATWRNPMGGLIDLWKTTDEGCHLVGSLNGVGVPGVEFSPDSRALAFDAGDSVIRIWEVPSCRLIGRLTGHKRAGINLSFSPDGRTLASMADDGTVRFWNLATSRELMKLQLPVEDILAHDLQFSPDGRSLAAFRDDPTGTLTQLWFAPSLAEIAVAEGKAYRSLAQDAATWHAVGKALEKRGRFEEAATAFAAAARQSGKRAEADGLRTSALLHRSEVLKRLGKFAQAGVANCTAQDIPARDPRTPKSCIDLSPYFNGSMDKEPINRTIPPTPFLNNFQTGVHTLPAVHGTQFDVRGVIQLKRGGDDFFGVVNVPGEMDEIQVRRRCHRVHFLHATGWQELDGAKIGSYVFHYADGDQLEVPILYGCDLAEWGTKENLGENRKYAVAWTGTNSERDSIRVFARTWENPRPDVEITSMDFVSKLTKCAPFLIGLTVEP